MVLTRSLKKILEANHIKVKEPKNMKENFKTKTKASSTTTKETELSLSSLEESDEDEEEDDEYDSDESEGYDDFILEDEEIYSLPKILSSNLKLKHKFDSIVSQIKDEEPTLEKILNLQIRKKRRKQLLQKFYIYKHSYLPFTDEKYYMKEELNKLIEMFEKEFSYYRHNKKQFLALEKEKNTESDIMILKKKLLSLETTDHNKKILFQKFSALETFSKDDEFLKLLHYMKLALSLPFDKMKIYRVPKDNITSTLAKIKDKLDQELFGLKKAKEQILLYLHNRLVNPTCVSSCLALIGSPGIGKTSISKLLATIFNLPFCQISLGGITNADEMLGFSYTYVGSKPGKIARALITMQCKNGVLFLDEVDKINSNSDCMHSLLSLLDSTQNHQFNDNFFGDLHLDMSKLWYITSMNTEIQDRALSDRMYYVTLHDYNLEDKVKILQEYLLRRCLENINLKITDVIFSVEVARYFILKVSPENSGIRKVKHCLVSFISKLLFCVNNKELNVSFSLHKKKGYKNLEFPVYVDKEMIDILLLSDMEETNPSISYLYL